MIAKPVIRIREENKSESEYVKLVSAYKCTDDEILKIKTLLKTKFGMDLPIKNTIDKTILGGFKIIYHDWVLDASIGNQLSKLKISLGD
jgi:F0F1-type ATP synthase delta subunit